MTHQRRRGCAARAYGVNSPIARAGVAVTLPGATHPTHPVHESWNCGSSYVVLSSQPSSSSSSGHSRILAMN
eukprot:1078079-Prymnesium_polylepis.1